MDEAKDGRRRGNCPEKRRRRPDIIGMGARDIRRKHVVQFKNAKIIRRGKISEPDEDYVWMHVHADGGDGISTLMSATAHFPTSYDNLTKHRLFLAWHSAGGKIIDPERRFWEAARDKEYAAQGLSELILHLSRITAEDGNDIMRKVAKGILQHGVTSFCPTVITSGQPQYKKLAKLLKRRPGSRDHAHILGAHLEGPFISQYKYGAHPAHLVREPDKGFSSVVEMYGKQLIDSTAMVTIAPELKGAQEAIQGLSQRGVIVSCGHSMADLPEAEKGLECGARMITHLFNAMQPFHHRDPGLVGLLGRREKKPYYGIIADGIHAHANSVRIAFKAHPEGAVLVTDAMGAMGLGDGLYKPTFVDVDVAVESTILYHRSSAEWMGTDTLAGSIATMDSCVRNFRKFTGCSIVEAIRAATLRPAEVLNMEKRKGSLSFGCDADIILLDTELRVVATIVSGEVAWIKDESILKCRWTY
eukprot:jgi/Bigna1/88397/estExt_fgenesh1_pg.C_310133